MKTKRVVKMVRRDEKYETFKSGCVRIGSLQYRIGFKTEPEIEGSKIFVFDDIMSAVLYRKHVQKLEYMDICFVEGTGYNVKEMKPVPAYHTEITKFWELVNEHGYNKALSLMWPDYRIEIDTVKPGSLMCDGFRPERVFSSFEIVQQCVDTWEVPVRFMNEVETDIYGELY